MDQSPFGRLPPELRNSIYALAMSGEKSIVFAPLAANMSRRTLKLVAPNHRRPHGLSLLKTCRQIRSESTMLVYATHDFIFIRNAGTLEVFAKMIGHRNAAALRSVTIKKFAMIGVDDTRTDPTGAIEKRLGIFGKLVKRYGWKVAIVDAEFYGYGKKGVVNEYSLKFNAGNVGQAWNEFAAEMERRVAACARSEGFCEKIVDVVCAWMELLLKC